jgi:hypothetical protein
MEPSYYTRFLLILVTMGFGVLSSCQGQQKAIQTQEVVASESTHTSSPLPTESHTPTLTPAPTETAEPTRTPIPSPEVIPGPEPPQFLLIPSGYLEVDDWFGVPIYPGWVNAQEAYDGYYYSADQPVRIIRAFYEEEMGKRGWTLTAAGETERGHQLIIFENDGQKAKITLYNFEVYSSDPGDQLQFPPSDVLIVVE